MKIIKQNEFEEEVKSGVTVVDFFATWCGPCRAMGMILEELQENNPDFHIVKVDVDESEALARKFGILSIPTIIIMQDGKMMEKHVGLMDGEDLENLVKSYLD